MNAKQANQVSIRNYLSSIGISPVSSDKRSSLYLAPYRADKQPSLKVSHQENLWVDYGNDNKGGTLIDLVLMLHPHYNVSDAIRAIEKSTQSFFSFHQRETLSNPNPNGQHQIAIGTKPTANVQPQIAISQKQLANNKKPIANSRICIHKIRPLGHHPAIINYINTRGIQLEIAKPYCSEVYFTVNEHKYFGIGNKNDSGWSIRNKFWKGCTAQGYSYYKNQTDKILVFEGIFDMLSFLEINSGWKRSADILTLNSLVNIKKSIPMLQQYQSIELYLDHDVAGKKATETIVQLFPNARDASKFYSSFKDLNEYHLAKEKGQRKKKD